MSRSSLLVFLAFLAAARPSPSQLRRPAIQLPSHLLAQRAATKLHRDSLATGKGHLSKRRNVGRRAREDWEALDEWWNGVDETPKGSSAKEIALRSMLRSVVERFSEEVGVPPGAPLFVLSTILVLLASQIKERRTSLKSLRISHGRLYPAFNPRKLEYLLEIPEDVKAINFIPKPRYKSAWVKIGNIPKEEAEIQLKPNSNPTATRTMKVAKIVVTEGKNEKTYTVRIKREIPKPTLSLDVAVFGRPKTNSGATGVKPRTQDYYMGEDSFFILNRKDNSSRTSLELGPPSVDTWPYFTTSLTQASAFGVADGVGGWREVGVDAGEYSKHFMFITKEALTITDGIGSDGELNPIKAMLFAQAATKKPGTTTASVATVNQSSMSLNVANLGDSGFLVIRNGKALARSKPQLYQFNMPYQLGNPEIEEQYNTANDADIYKVGIREGDVVIMATDGLYDNIPEKKIVKTVNSGMDSGKDLNAIAQELVDLAFNMSFKPNAPTPWSKSMTREVIPRWRRAMGGKVRGGKRDDITVLVGVVRADY
mmetsp:Transcript_2296/g.3269  ORF Transcript_2296/g.3269 Transcript_2296/m.3269 type:complete len:540 (-) Transcript_2296:69-1688(-)|eukprot:CAMPEP_0184480522 /NCGR_PEP_ID=MMETSP0113_2-20130426/2030_1 /TAXON_ID=91329 /ORGANISM="Norrisiella sphaerica, Strain BC52" /LENGTH=539 /DNA_ID=CAMNT_0026859061 /DNA_START=308 /DNA_END=1927 /DNA_ORIENTATION=-